MVIDDICVQEFDNERKQENHSQRTYFVIGGENYTPKEGEECHKAKYHTPCKAGMEFRDCLADYQLEGHNVARIWQITTNEEGRVGTFEIYREREIEPDL